MKDRQLRVLERLARAFEACSDQEHASFVEQGVGRDEFGQLPVSAMALAHHRAMQAFHWCLEAVEEEMHDIKEELAK